MASGQLSYRNAMLQDLKQFADSLPRCVIHLQKAVRYAVLPSLNEPWTPHRPPPLMDHL